MEVSFKGKLNVLYFSDVHSKLNHVPNLKTVVDSFERKYSNEPVLNSACGDLTTDIAMKQNKIILKLMDKLNIKVSSLGNHDLEGGNYWVQAMEDVKSKVKFLSCNIDFLRPSAMQNHVAPSAIVDCKGVKIGAIGVSPVDYNDMAFCGPYNDYVSVRNFEETKKLVEKEVESLKTKGIDKIFLYAHTGKESAAGEQYYKELAQIDGVSVIVGGHDHKRIDKWFQTKNGKPVKVVSTGSYFDKKGEKIQREDLADFGVLNLEFDKNGILIPEKCKNEFFDTSDFAPNQGFLALAKKYLKNEKTAGLCSKELYSLKKKEEENPVASLCADAMIYAVNKRIENISDKAVASFVNSGTVRGNIPKGEVTLGDIRGAFPFTCSTLVVAPLSVSQIRKTLDYCVKSIKKPRVDPGVMQVGGLKYTIDKELNVKDIFLLNKDGSLGEKLDDLNRTINVCYDVFLMSGVHGLKDLYKHPNERGVQYFDLTRQDSLIEYMSEKYASKEVKLNTERIEFLKSESNDFVKDFNGEAVAHS